MTDVASPYVGGITNPGLLWSLLLAEGTVSDGRRRAHGWGGEYVPINQEGEDVCYGYHKPRQQLAYT